MAFLEYRPKQPLFQYCSVDGFLGIVRSRQLWFSDLLSANDPREMKLGHQHFVDALKSVRHDEYRGETGLFLSVLAGRLAGAYENTQAFCCCFSLVADELPMWAAYGDGYNGLAIGFRPTAILSIPARVQKVNYLNENTAQDFRSLALEIADQLDAGRNLQDEVYWIEAAVSAIAGMTALKHQTWAYEREIRMVHVQPIAPPDEQTKAIPTGILPGGQQTMWTQPSERLSSSRKVSYLKFSYGKFENNYFDHKRAIRKIIIGPKCQLSISEVTKILSENGFEQFEVVESTCEIR